MYIFSAGLYVYVFVGFVFFVNCFVMFILVGLCVFALLGYGLCLFDGLCVCINKADLKRIDAPARLL